ILGHILGSKDVSRSVASNAASATGLSPAVLQQMLPVVAALAMGALSKQTGSAGTGAASLSQIQSRDSIGSLSGFLDVNRDGSGADDVMRFVGKLFSGGHCRSIARLLDSSIARTARAPEPVSDSLRRPV